MAIFDLSQLKNIEDIQKKILEESQDIDLKEEVLQEGCIGLCNIGEKMFGRGVFISHRSTHKSKAKKIAKFLDRNGYDIYLDSEDIYLSLMTSVFDNVDKELIKECLSYGIKHSEYFLCLLTKDIDKSEWVKGEFKEAQKRKKEVAGYLVDINKYPKENLAEISFPDYLKGMDHIDRNNIGSWLYMHNPRNKHLLP